MRYIDAVKIAEANKHLIGQQWNGAIIDEIIIAPTDSSQWEEYSRMYIQTLNAQQSIVPFMNSDVSVFVVCDKKRIRSQNLFVFSSIYELSKKLNVKSIQ